MIRRPPRSPLFPSPTLSRPPYATSLGRGASCPATFPAGGGSKRTAFGCSTVQRPVSSTLRTPAWAKVVRTSRSEEHTSELQSRQYLVCRLLLEKKKKATSLT